MARKDYGAKLRVWDNGGKTLDRFTMMPPSSATRSQYWDAGLRLWDCYCTCESARVHWDKLPAPVRNMARENFPEYCPKDAN